VSPFCVLVGNRMAITKWNAVAGDGGLLVPVIKQSRCRKLISPGLTVNLTSYNKSSAYYIVEFILHLINS
jgi:hypothetical protein